MSTTKTLGIALAGALTLAACGSNGGASADPTTPDDTTVTTEAESDDEMSEDEMSEDEMSDDEMSDDEMSDDEMSDEGPVTFTVRIENVSGVGNIASTGVFNTPDGAGAPGPALPGSSYSFSVNASPGDRVSFATMLVQTNDWFFAPTAGIELYDDDGNAVSGDVTDQIQLLDAGTEIDEEYGQGANQAPRQTGPDSGAEDPDDEVRELSEDVADLISVEVTPGSDGEFTITVTNVTADDMASPFAPGVWAVHQAETSPLFTVGEEDAGQGLEALAEDGDPSGFAEYLTGTAGYVGPLAPGVWVLDPEGNALFQLDEADFGQGLEALAEDGSAGELGAAVDGAEIFSMPVGGGGAGPAFPGAAYEFEITAEAGDRFNFATMFVQSNDWFFASTEGIDLFDGVHPVDGDITNQISLLDAGTEADQTVGFGSDQAPRQAGPNTGDVDPDNAVREVMADVESLIQVTITPQS
jgi:pentapeptide MXKDX repeat protein